ncbi:MAG TPA: DUF2062 domain-containing protein [Thermoanaerobaculia bacterium]|nr:DUF2062 domain-containing protein [Thermoanaerobaculia bacterium]
MTSPGRTFAELVYRLRTEGGSPGRQAWAVGLGAFIGCLPLYGLHLALCVAAGRLFGLNRIKAYLAAQLNNPLSAPLVVAVELAAGRLLRGGDLAGLAPARLAERGAAGVGIDLALGSLAVGAAAGAALGAATWWTLRARRRPPAVEALIEAAARPYLAAGVAHWEIVRGKLRHDPLYLGLLARGPLPERGRFLDLGCGRGIALALLAAAREAARRGELPAGWTAPAAEIALHGIEGRRRTAAAAAKALAGVATIAHADLATAPLPAASAVLLLDVLHYLPAAEQERLLARAAACLEPGGVLFVREADAAGGARFLATRAAERLCALARGHLRQRFRYRSAAAWRDLVAAQGLEAAPPAPLAQGTPYANVLLVARR